jgi:type II secretory pathway component GspD/PulD (secretin)
MKVSMRLVAAIVLVTAVVLSGGGQVQAQQTAKPEAPPPVPLKVTVSISRYDGDKRTASLPFVLWVNTGGTASIQMGSDVPVPSTQISTSKEGTTTPVQAYTYRSLGTNLSVSASALGDGLFKVNVGVQDSQVFRMPATGGSQLGPVFQNFRSSNEPILRDGQTVQFAVATDKTSGEVIKIDVTLNLVK